jgi:hypothetical protein
MVLQPPQARVCSGSQSLLASCGVARLEAEIAQLKEALIGCWPSASPSVLSRSARSLPTTPTTKTVASLTQD